MKMHIWNQTRNNNIFISSNTPAWPHKVVVCMSYFRYLNCSYNVWYAYNTDQNQGNDAVTIVNEVLLSSQVVAETPANFFYQLKSLQHPGHWRLWICFGGTFVSLTRLNVHRYAACFDGAQLLQTCTLTSPSRSTKHCRLIPKLINTVYNFK